MKLDVIYNKDFLKVVEIDNGSIDMIVTSPPYFNARSYSNWDTYEEYILFADAFIKKSFDLLKDGGRIAINIPDGYDRNPWIPIYADYCKILQHNNFILRGNIVWHKHMGGTLGGRTSWGSWRSSSNPCLIDMHEMIIVAHKNSPKILKSSQISKENFMQNICSVWNVQPQTRKKNGHPAPYPLEIPYRLIELFTGKNNIVLDPFMGSGTTALACSKLNRHYIGYEIVKNYYLDSIERINKFKNTLDK